MKIFRILLLFAIGGGIFLNADELRDICKNSLYNCTITSSYGEVTNSGHLALTGAITLDNNAPQTNGAIDTFINYGTIDTNRTNATFYWSNGYVRNVVNYGTMGGFTGIRSATGGSVPMSITNYGVMSGISTEYGTGDITIANYGVINVISNNQHLRDAQNYFYVLKDWAMIIDESPSIFNGTNTATGNNSHIFTNVGHRIRFADSSSKIILDFGNNFELDKAYSLDNIIIDTNRANKLKVDFDRLTTRSSLYKLTQQGNSFIVTIDTANSEMGTLYKSNIRTMNNFTTISESLIYPHKYKGTNRSGRKRVIRRIKRSASLRGDSTESPKQSTNQSRIATTSSLRGSGEATTKQSTNANKYANLNDLNESWIASANQDSPRNDESFALDSLSLNDTFFYKSDSLLLADSQSEQRAKRMRNSTQNLNTRSVNQSNNNSNSMNQSNNTNRTTITNQTINRTTKTNQNYYFILTPFVNHNYFFESGRYNLSGLEYGFVTAFSGKLNNNNSLGTHFVFSYASLNDKDDSAFNIKSMNLNLGLNYKLDLIYSMYLKVRIDGYYFLNEVKSIAIRDKIKPNTIGFGGSIYYGKDWNFNNYGLLGLSGGVDYKGLYANAITFANANERNINEQYSKTLQNMLYVDVGVDYGKYFNTSVGLWGLNAKAGIKGNTLFMLKGGSVNVQNRVFDMIVDNDKVLGYANISGSYVINTKDFDMEFSIAYYGNYGDRVISNGGGFEWRVGW